MLVVLKKIRRYKKALQTSKTLITKCKKIFFYFEYSKLIY